MNYYQDYLRNLGFMFEVHLTEHCNLNCKGCSHFSPLANKEFMDIAIFEKDMAQMFQLLDKHDIRRIRLLGGEPLLHSQVNEFMEIAANYFPDTRREIVTNGLLLLNMPESFWETCRTTKTSIHVSRYPVNLDFKEMENVALEHGIEIVIYASNFRMDSYDMDGSQDGELSHSTCGLFGYCCQLNNGRFYPCSISAYFHHFNRYFDLKIPFSNDNFIDIYKAQSKNEFYQLIITPIPFCRYCNIKARRHCVKWEHSKKQISEWYE